MEVKTNTSVVPFEAIAGILETEVKNEGAAPRMDFFSANLDEVSTDIVTQKPAPTATPKPSVKAKDEKKEEDEEEIEEVIGDEEEEGEEELETPETVIEQIVSVGGKGKKEVSKDGDYESEDINLIYNELVKDEFLTGFDDGKPVTNLKDLKVLIKENLKKQREQVVNEELPQFIESLPNEVQVLVKYATDGGKDFKSMFKALAEVEEFRKIEVKENDVISQEQIAEQYLKTVGYAKGDMSEIRDQINEWKENKTLYKRAQKFKDQMDEMQESLVSQKLKEQEEAALMEHKKAEQQRQVIYESLKDSDLNGIKVDKQTQAKLFTGLTQKAWKSQAGSEVDLLDALIEYYKYEKKDYKTLGEVLYRLLEPEEFNKKQALKIKEEVTSSNVRTIKTEQGRRAATSSAPPESRGIKRGGSSSNNFWNK